MTVGNSMVKLIGDFTILPYGVYAVEIARKDALKTLLIVLYNENGIKTSGEEININECFSYEIERIF